MKKLPVGIQSFKDIIVDNYVYVDKTQYVYSLISGVKYYFLSRPRRFGKSLLLDTIGEVFKGDKELFAGLWIHGSDYGFEKHPVIRLDMSNISNATPEIFNMSIAAELRKRIAEEGLVISCEIPSDMFKSLIEGLYKKYNKRVVVLIDEYDKPILDHITDVEKAEANRAALRGFYGVLKSMDPYLRLTFITGVTKFAKTSIFSGLNNLSDITLDEDYANICGITIDDLDKYFGEHIKHLSITKKTESNILRDEILKWYDGYSWDGEVKLINPFSLLSFLTKKRLSGFWYSTGSPNFLTDLIKEKPAAYTNLKNLIFSEEMLDYVNIDRISVEPLLFQTGYLTVQEVITDSDGVSYRLRIPNFEVKRAFNIHVLSAMTENDDVDTGNARREMLEALLRGDLQKTLDLLRGLFASIPYELHVDVEAYYHSIFYAVMNVLGFDIDAEVSVSKGRIDAALELADKVYVMEFKYKGCPPGAGPEEKKKIFDDALDEGMAQIKGRGYHEKYAGSGKTVYLAAFAFLGRSDIEMSLETVLNEKV